MSASKDKKGVLKTQSWERYIFYSVSLILKSSGIKDEYENKKNDYIK